MNIKINNSDQDEKKSNQKRNHEIKNHLYDGQTVIIPNLDNSHCPRNLVKEICESNVNDLTLIYVTDSIKYEDGDNSPVEIIKNGQVRKLITCDLGDISDNYADYVDSIELYPMDILKLKIQASANFIPGDYGIYISKEYAEKYRDEKYISEHIFTFDDNNKSVVLEEPFDADISIISVDSVDKDSFNCKIVNKNNIDIIKNIASAGNMCFVEKCNNNNYEESNDNYQISGKIIYGFI